MPYGGFSRQWNETATITGNDSSVAFRKGNIRGILRRAPVLLGARCAVRHANANVLQARCDGNHAQHCLSRQARWTRLVPGEFEASGIGFALMLAISSPQAAK